MSTHGAWKIGVEFSDYMLMERNRHNYVISTKKRTNFTKIGYYYMCLVDIAQILHEENYNITLFQD